MTTFVPGSMINTSTQLSANSITAGNISVTGSGLPTNGMYLPSANTLSLATNSTQVVTLDSSGNMGINTTSMNAVLNVQSNGVSTTAGGNVVGRLQSNGTGRDTTLQLSDNVTNSITISQLSGATIFRTNGVESMRIDSSGSVGIGSASPAGKLDVAGISTGTFGMRATQTDTGAYVSLGFDNSANNAQIVSSGNGYFRIFTNNTERMRIDGSGYMQGTVNGLGAGRIPAMQYYRLNADYVGASSISAQSVFGVGVTLVGSTQYGFEMYLVFSKTATASAHNFSLGFGGTATFNNILYGGPANWTGAVFTSGLTGAPQTFDANTASPTVVATPGASANNSIRLYIIGSVSINAGGTFTPQYTTSVAVGPWSTVAGSYIRIYPLAASGTNVSVGTWA